ncbi:MAG: hypothetical protein VB022_06845 [Rikenellaceae bacterium]|nr:hypothetical protein [Rikenellaceae bacterium]
MNIKLMLFTAALSISLPICSQEIYKSKSFTIYPNRIVQGGFMAKAISENEIFSNYKSYESERYSPEISFKFSINGRDNEMMSGEDHIVTLSPVNGHFTTSIKFGERVVKVLPELKNTTLLEETSWTVLLDMRHVFKAFDKDGYYTLFNGDRLYQKDLKNIFIAGSSTPLIWDFNNLYCHPELELKDPDGDRIYETTLIMNSKKNIKRSSPFWKLSRDISAFPQYKSDFPISDAIYNLSLEEMINAIEPDSTFRTGKEWSGVWTRDISYSIILSLAYLQPKVAKYSLLRKVKNGVIVQDTGTGGAYPVSTDRMVWAIAAWELYKVTGDKQWLRTAYDVIKRSVEQDILNAYDKKTGMVKGESSFLDWREQTYPNWMEPADIYESECLGTNAIHYQANMVLSDMAEILNERDVAEKHIDIARKIKMGVNKYLWMDDKGFYSQYLYGRNYKIVSSRSEALGEALSVIFGIADDKKSRSIVSKTPVTSFGISCIFPQIPHIPPYHNNAVWPFVQSYWALASAKAQNEKAVLESIAAIYRPTAMFLTNKENFVAETGDYAGTQINSSNMLWSLAGNLALIYRVFFGLNYCKDSLVFTPFVPNAFDGKRTLNNVRVRSAILNIEMSGSGNKIRAFYIDGKPCSEFSVPYTLSGVHSIKIVLENSADRYDSINMVENYMAPETPTAGLCNGILSWNVIKNAQGYLIIKNGKVWKKINDNSIEIARDRGTEYQVVAIDSNGVESFASEPVVDNIETTVKIGDDKQYVEISKTSNTKVEVPVCASVSGMYSIRVRYANGSGPINTDNKCAIRTLKVNGQKAGVFVFPQRGTNEWSNWGYSNILQIKLMKGNNKLEIYYDPLNENMNGEINNALLDALILSKR